MRKSLFALLLATGAASTNAADVKNACPEGPTTLTGTLGENKLFAPPEYWVGQSAPCAVNVVELAKPDASCVKGAAITVTGKVEHVREDGELSLVHIVNPDKYTCGK